MKEGRSVVKKVIKRINCPTTFIITDLHNRKDLKEEKVKVEIEMFNSFYFISSHSIPFQFNPN